MIAITKSLRNTPQRFGSKGQTVTSFVKKTTQNTFQTPQSFAKSAALWGSLGTLAYYLQQLGRPFFLCWVNHTPTGIGGDKPSAFGSIAQDTQRRASLDQHLWQTYGAKGKITWHDTADIADWIAGHTQNDHDFRRDVWYVFGWRQTGERSPWATLLDSTNQDLKVGLHNEGSQYRRLYNNEQMHHYLGGVTGNLDTIPTHLRNNLFHAWAYELKELVASGHYNLGDVRLFRVAQQHRDDFLTQGRFVVGQNIRKLLTPAAPQLQSTSPVPAWPYHPSVYSVSA